MNKDRTHARTTVSLLLGGLTLAALTACGGPLRPVKTDEEFKQVAIEQNKEINAAFSGATHRIFDRLTKEMNEATDGSTGHLDFLAISGGGDYGAFGAGFLVGWGKTPDPAQRRPDFDVVTGVSTGALLAPFVFLNTDEACAQVESFYRNPRTDWLEGRGMFYFLPSFPSFMKIPGLDRDIRSAVDMPFIEKVAEQSRKGKILAVSATDLDVGRQMFWNIGVEAEKATKTGDKERIPNMMLASAAIPAAFPPIEIDGALYADGGVTANVFLRLEPRNPEGVIQLWRHAYPGKPLPKIRYWVIINNQLQQRPKTVQPRWPAIISPSLATAVRSSTITEVRLIAAQADYVNAAMHADIEVRVIAIPDDWRPPVEGDFQKETMESLSDLGRKLGADPNSWQLWASPKMTIDSVKPATTTKSE